MKALKTALILLLAWTFSVQATAGVSGAVCHQGGALAAAPPAEHATMTMANDAHAMHAAGHADHRKAAAAGSAHPHKAASDPGDDCLCQCADPLCGSAAWGLAAGPAEGIARFLADALRPARGAASAASAHAHELIRPPSIT